MAKPEHVPIEEAAEKVIPIADPEAEPIGLPGAVTKRPFVLDKKHGSGGGNMPLMLMVIGAILVFGIGMLAFLSSPIVWTPEMINRGSTVMRLNPLTHLFAIWREPLATGQVPMASMTYVLACLAALVLAGIVTFHHLRKAAFWI